METWIRNFNAKPYKGEFWEYENFRAWPLFALHARRLTDEVTDFQVASVCFQYAVVDQFIERTQTYEIIIHPNKKVTNTASEPIKRNIMNPPKWINFKSKIFKKILIRLMQGSEDTENPYYYFQYQENAEKIADYIINRLKRAPRSERYIFVVDNIDDLKNHSYILDLFKRFKIPFHGSINLGKSNKFAIPSFTILQLFFKALRPEHPVGLDPVLGGASTNDVALSRMENKRLVSLSMEEVEVSKVADSFWAGKAGSIIHDACFHTFKICSISSDENKAIVYVLSNILKPYISDLEKNYTSNLETFFEKYNINGDNRKIIKKVLKISNLELDLIVAKIKRALRDQSPQSIDVNDLLAQPEDHQLLEAINPDRIEEARNEIIDLKNMALKLRATKRFRWSLEDGDLWANFSQNQVTWNKFFEETKLSSLSVINNEIYKLVILDMKKNANFWRSEFKIHEGDYQLAN